MRIKPHSSEKETLKSVQVHQLTASPRGSESYSTDSLHPLGPWRLRDRSGSQQYCGDSGQQYLPGGGEPPAELPVVAGEPCGTPRSPPAHWDTDGDTAPALTLC